MDGLGELVNDSEDGVFALGGGHTCYKIDGNVRPGLTRDG